MPSNKSPQTQEAAPAYLTRSVKRRLQRDEQSSLPIPDQLVRHCLSFVGDGNYFFLASVSRQVKRCVEMEFSNDRNTSAESIVASKETFVRFMDIFCADPTFVVEREERIEEGQRVLHLVQCAIFKTDNVDLYENFYVDFFCKHQNTDDDKESFISTVWPAVGGKSIQIMKRIISNDETLSKMMQYDAPEEDENVAPVKIASCITSACDVEMIEYLRGKGVDFNARSLYYALRGGRIDTLRHLLDFFPSDFEGMDILELFKIAGSACKSGGYEGLRVLKEKGWLKGPLQEFVYAFLIEWELPLEVLEILLDGETDAIPLLTLVIFHSIGKGRHDFLEYFRESQIRINAEMTIANVFENGNEEAAEILRNIS
ncbi:predicted protein [Chaetoceros tenuissimus]|uniref:Uncharacterized protein n=1 Tax=Chaetoceros tenuissimus TaxID=426638 RepID=A0AAD3CLX7_9STRA|nr:predicted protein [Chaetoceros tenuissimus]